VVLASEGLGWVVLASGAVSLGWVVLASEGLGWVVLASGAVGLGPAGLVQTLWLYLRPSLG
jgi:hypothetical protein